tara:strand:- start:49 stop:513 length:465 start_codon:yes stop_codon:yes gene_type:complete
MSYTQIKKEQILNTDIKNLWDFMSSPKNLSRITPKSMLFKITSNNKNDKIYPGMIISYKVAPLFNIPITWVTEITHVKENKYFVDEQRIGPYKIWHHEHIFKPLDDKKILVTDIITYVPPFGFIGKILNKILIKKKVEDIFDYRERILEDIFNK